MCHYIHTRVNIVTGTEVSYDLRLISRPVLLSTLQMFIPIYFVAIDTCTPREVLLRRLKRCPVEVSGPLLWPLVGSRSPTLITCWKMNEYIGWCIRVDFERAFLWSRVPRGFGQSRKPCALTVFWMGMAWRMVEKRKYWNMFIVMEWNDRAQLGVRPRLLLPFCLPIYS